MPISQGDYCSIQIDDRYSLKIQIILIKSEQNYDKTINNDVVF